MVVHPTTAIEVRTNRKMRSGIALPTGTLAALALAGANVLWAGSAAASKAALDGMTPVLLASARVGIALVILRMILARRGHHVATGTVPALLGLTGVALFCACQNVGLLFADATTTALIGSATPVLTVGMAMLFLGERPGSARASGMAISLAGVAVVMMASPGGLAVSAATSSLLPLASASSFALYNVIGRRAFAGIDALPLVAGSTRYGLMFLLPVTILEMMRTSPKPVTLHDGLLLLYLGVGCSAVAFILCGYGLTHLDAGHGAVFGNLKPIVGVGVSMALLGEPLTVNQVLGGILVILGVGLTGRQAPGAGLRAPRASMPAARHAAPCHSGRGQGRCPIPARRVASEAGRQG
jgi:drug/metabolite transporter (DMT)-like permease